MSGKRFVVVGLGNFGSSVVESLWQLDHEVIAIDLSRERVEKVADISERAIVGDGTEPSILEAAGVEEAEGGVISTGRDVTASVLTTLALRDLRVSMIFVKVISDLHARIIDQIGGAETVFPERETARLVARRVASRSILHYVELGPGFSAEELVVPDEWVGRTLRDLALPRQYNVSVIAVRDYLSGQTRPVPDPDAPLKDSDTLFLAGSEEALGRLSP